LIKKGAETMFDMQIAPSKVSENQEKNPFNYEIFLHEGIALYEQYTADQKESTLIKAADKFFLALNYKRSDMEPYLFLSLIFFLFDEITTAKVYFETASALPAEHPEFAELKRNIGQLIYFIIG
jgi:hypothetical protein